MEYDIFIGHAWRFHEHWKNLARELDELEDFRWRNFSVPWHDPAFSANSDNGSRRIRRWLEAQIAPSQVVVVPDGIWEIRSARRWLEHEIDLARRSGIEVIAMTSPGKNNVDPSLLERVDTVITWGAAALRDHLQNARSADRSASSPSIVAQTALTSGIREDYDSREWQEHRFGMPLERWASFAGRSFWITGAGSGYGHAMAAALAAADATVFLSGRRREKLEESKNDIARLGIPTERCRILPCDVANPASVADAVRSISMHSARLGGLVNNAAEPLRGDVSPLQKWSWESWESMLRTNLTGGWLTARAALPLMTGGDGLRILFISSGAGWASTPDAGPYNISKAALNNLAMSLAAEVERDHPHSDCQINTLNPGESFTEMNQGATASAFAVVPSVLALLSHPPGGPNGRFFHRNGSSMAFCEAAPWPKPLLEPCVPQGCTSQADLSAAAKL